MSLPRTYFSSILAVLTLVSLLTASTTNAVEVVPSGRLFRLTFADPQEIRMMVALDRGDKIHAIVGNYFSLLGLGTESKDGLQVHLGLEGRGFFTMRQENARFPLETVDGMVGAYLDAKYDALQMQLRYTHVSAHLADGLAGTATAYSRETATFRLGYVPDGDLQLYAGVSTVVNSYPAVAKIAGQLGGSYFLPTGIALAPFAGIDVQWREEWQRTGIAVQLGVGLNKPSNRYRSFRIFYGYYSGGDIRGQFFGQPVTSHSLGLEMQI